MSAQGEAPYEEGSLGESTYEFIDTDEESRDDNAESIASTEFCDRPDDVASLADTEQSGEESGDEDTPLTESVPAIHQSHDHTVEEAFNTPTIGRSNIFPETFETEAQSIEFEEPFNLGAETVSVKHTVADYDEEKTAEVVEAMMLKNPPKRIAVTIHQTMTKQGLSTKDPLRILYVGSPAGKEDIIRKIGSSIASINSNTSSYIRASTSQIYTVVPVSAFGSEHSTPEVELIHSSGYQFKVEDCTFAETLVFEDADKPDVLKLTVMDGFAYHSVP